MRTRGYIGVLLILMIGIAICKLFLHLNQKNNTDNESTV